MSTLKFTIKQNSVGAVMAVSMKYSLNKTTSGAGAQQVDNFVDS